MQNMTKGEQVYNWMREHNATQNQAMQQFGMTQPGISLALSKYCKAVGISKIDRRMKTCKS